MMLCVASVPGVLVSYCRVVCLAAVSSSGHSSGFVFQTFNLIPSMNAEENVSLPMILAGDKSRASIARRSQELLSRVGLGHRMDHLPSQLSGGEQQRVTIARAIANRPQLLLLDEPTGDLDTVNGTIILSLLLQLNRHEGITCVMVTHDQSLKHYAHRVVHMVDGKVLRIEVIDGTERSKADTELQRRMEEIEGDRAAHEESRRREEKTEAVTELRDTANFYEYIRQQEVDSDDRDRRERLERQSRTAAVGSGGVYAIMPGISAVVTPVTGGESGRPGVRIQTDM
jgi:ABC-type lipoprotein export system ATPase subunit